MSGLSGFTPRETVGELDRYIVGQNKAKRAVAVALRNRFRRQRVSEDMRDEIAPKNIILIGPTGVGKTEIARRLAKLAQAPFVKVEASKFTEVGYVGRDVESIVRDLVEASVALVRAEALEEVRGKAREAAENKLIRLLAAGDAPAAERPAPQNIGPFVIQTGPREDDEPPEPSAAEYVRLRKALRAGEMEDELVSIQVEEGGNGPMMSVFGGPGMEDLQQGMRDMLGSLPGLKGRGKPRKLPVKEARRILEEQEAERLVDQENVHQRAVERAEQSGIVFLDEIDKIASAKGPGGSADVSRQGVQRDLLPIVEGSSVNTRYGQVRTDHVLFIAAGAFHVAEVSDLIPELQGRFPVRVELEPLTQADFKRILTEPKNALTRQYQALMATEGIELSFAEEALDALAHYASEANGRSENIGARRLHTIMETLLDELSFSASERAERKVHIDAEEVRARLEPVLQDQDLSRYIL